MPTCHAHTRSPLSTSGGAARRGVRSAPAGAGGLGAGTCVRARAPPGPPPAGDSDNRSTSAGRCPIATMPRAARVAAAPRARTDGMHAHAPGAHQQRPRQQLHLVERAGHQREGRAGPHRRLARRVAEASNGARRGRPGQHQVGDSHLPQLRLHVHAARAVHVHTPNLVQQRLVGVVIEQQVEGAVGRVWAGQTSQLHLLRRGGALGGAGWGGRGECEGQP